jgi:hypothetical protein
MRYCPSFSIAIPFLLCHALIISPSGSAADSTPRPEILVAESFRHYIDDFNTTDDELYQGNFPNATAWDFLKDNIPLLDCPDKDISTTYYFRWWTYRKHIKKTPGGFVVDEFLPNVSWAGKYNTISCAAGHHIYEGRWLLEPKFLDDYTRFWFHGGGDPRRYSFWAADAVWARYCVTGDKSLAIDLLPDLIKNYEAWEKSHRDPNGLYWQIDDRDGMEVSIGGSGYRATINSYQYGDAIAIAKIADLAGKTEVARVYRGKASAIKRLVQEKLWDNDAQFFKVLPRGMDKQQGNPLAVVRELHGFTPWYFNLPDPRFAPAWKQAIDPQGFFALYGPTTAEQRSPKFALSYTGHECQWNGPSWPYATSIMLTALANLLNGPPQDAISAKDYFDLLKIYAKSQRRTLPDKRVVPWIDENLNPATGDWISRTLLIQRSQQPIERGKDYNHSTFCDLVISGLIGLRPRADNIVEVNPLAPPSWDYFCLDHIAYHGRIVTILFDKNGRHYGRGKGLRVWANGKEIAASASLGRITGNLPQNDGAVSASASNKDRGTPEAIAQTSAGWKKFEGNPVMGGIYGTCFDVCVLRERHLPYVAFLAAEKICRTGRKQRRPALERTAANRSWTKTGDRLGRRHQSAHRVEARGRLPHVVHGPGPGPFADRLCRQSRRRRLEENEREAGPVARPAMGESRRDVPARAVGCRSETIPHVVFGRRTV